MQLVRGQKIKLGDVLDTAYPFFVDVAVQSPFVTDVAVFALNAHGKLLADDYMIFYNQPTSPCGAVQLSKNDPTLTQFCLDLNHLPNTIAKLVLTLTIDGNDTMHRLGNSSVNMVNQHNQSVASFALNGTMFNDERAIMALEIYQKDGIWRTSAVGQGFNGGLPALIEYFGGEVAQSEPTQTQPTQPPAPQTANPSKLDLKKKLSLQKAEQTGNASIIDLTKKSLIQLEKRHLLDVKAKVALVLDASGSMNWQYKNGDVQKIVNRLMPLAINFDDDGQFECWAFANLTTRLDDVNLNNVNDFVNTTQHGWQNWHVGSRINNEIPAITAVIDHFCPNQLSAQLSTHTQVKQGFFDQLFGKSSTPQTPTHSNADKTPVYVLFISDGGVGSSRQMQQILTACANLPIFWQFVGVGGSNYGVLEKLDTMTGRVVDNCNFFSLDNIGSISDDKLYELLLDEFPIWLTNAKNKGIISN